MLVITRRPSERVVFPSLGIKIQLLQSSASAARIGIEAPREIPILCEEPHDASDVPSTRAAHDLANMLGRASLAVHLAKRQAEAGRSADAAATLEIALASLESLDLSRRRLEPPARRCHALIVEDDANERELLAGLLGMNGCRCDQVGDGEDALAYLDSGSRPDVILLDMAMPRCDGPATLRRIRAEQRYAGLKIFSVSSTPPHELGIPNGPDGFDAWFAKPLNPGRLWEAMQQSLRGPDASD